MMCGLDANWCVLSIDVVVSQWGWHMSWSCTLILDCHNTTYKVKRRNNNYARYYCQNTQITSWGSARPNIKFWVYMLDKYIFVDFYSIHLIQALIRQGSWSSVGVLENFSLSWVVKHPRCIHDLTWDLTLTHRGLIWSRVVVFWWSRCALSMVRTSQQHSANANTNTSTNTNTIKDTNTNTITNTNTK